MAWQFPVTAPFPWTDGVSGTIPHAADFQAIASDIQGWGGNVNAGGFGLANAGYLNLTPGDLPGTTYTVTAISWASGHMSYTVSPNHNIQVGQIVSVSGMTPAGANVSQVPVTSVTTPNIFAVAMATNPGAATAFGTVLVGGITPATGMIAMNPSGVILEWYGGGWINPVSIPTNIGINTGGTAFTTLDVGGAIRLRTLNLTCVNGANENVNIGTYSVISVTGPTAAYQIGGFTGGVDGRILILINDVNVTLTINHADTGSIATNRIFSPKGASQVLNTNFWSTAWFVYQASNSNWWLMGWF